MNVIDRKMIRRLGVCIATNNARLMNSGISCRRNFKKPQRNVGYNPSR